VTQPNDLRARATSIFERLRGTSPNTGETQLEPDGLPEPGSADLEQSQPIDVPDEIPHPGPPPEPSAVDSRSDGDHSTGNSFHPQGSGSEAAAGGAHEADRAGEPADVGQMATGEVTAGEMATGEVTAGEMATGEVTAGEAAAAPVGQADSDQNAAAAESSMVGHFDRDAPTSQPAADDMSEAGGEPDAVHAAVGENADQNLQPMTSMTTTARPDSGSSDEATAGTGQVGEPTVADADAGDLGDAPVPGEAQAAAPTATDPVDSGAGVSTPASSFERQGFKIPPPPAPETAAGNYGTRIHPSARNRPLPRTLAVANQKGGVGKTTTAVNLGAALAELDYRVLVVDLDPQGNATTGLGINGRNLDASIYDVILHDVPVEDVIEPTTLKNLFVVPATIDLAGAEIELVPVFSRELRLKKGLEPIIGDFDYVLIDCPPSLGLLTVNGLAAATEVAVPIQCEYYALEGLGQLLRNVGLVQTNLNGDLEVSTIILTMYDARTKLAEQVAEEVRQYFGDRVCRNVVPRTVRLSEAPSFGQPIIVFDPSSRGSIAYRELAKEVSGGAPKRTR
jgi:chromosome partitioning protein